MWKILLLCLAITSPTWADEQINHSHLVIPKGEMSDPALQSFLDLAVDEYNYSDFGFSRDLFHAIAVKSDHFPICYMYLGKIYEQVAQFKDLDTARSCYLSAASSKRLEIIDRQESYLALIRLTDDSNLAKKYAQLSMDLSDTDFAKQGMILAYQKEYEKTGNESALEKSQQLTRALDQQYFQTVVDVQDVNFKRP